MELGGVELGGVELGEVELILYVHDQQRSRDFYASVLGRQPTLDVPGMTEFRLGPGCTLGLMPQAGIARLLGLDVRQWTSSEAVPAQCELYLRTTNPADAVERALRAGARMLSPMAHRDWGEDVAYLADLDGHILALAMRPGRDLPP